METSIECSLREDLECTICLELAISPIYNCFNGHIICGICVRQVKVCGCCQEGLEVCWLAERLVKNLLVSCHHEEIGCTIKVSPSQMLCHISECEYRPIRCFEKKKSDCGGRYWHLNGFAQHLIDFHDVYQIQTCNSGQDLYRFKNYRDSLKRDNTTPCPVLMIKGFKGNNYLLHERYKNGLIYRWLTVIGGTREADLYKFTLNMHSKGTSESQFSWTFPVLPLHAYCEKKEVMDSGHFASIHWESLKSICQEIVFNKFPYKYSWCNDIKFERRTAYNQVKNI